MTKSLIGVAFLVLLSFVAWEVWQEWLRYNPVGNQPPPPLVTPVSEIVPEQLAGMPVNWEEAYKKATNGGAKTWGAWLSVAGQRVQDPRRAWIELDYMVMISKEDPQEAKKIFAMVKERTPTNSPVYPRIQELEKTYE